MTISNMPPSFTVPLSCAGPKSRAEKTFTILPECMKVTPPGAEDCVGLNLEDQYSSANTRLISSIG